MSRGLEIVVLGLSITSSWGNGHATTYRALIRGLHALGHRVLFLERDVPWYANNRDEVSPRGCRTELYKSFDDLALRFSSTVRNSDAVIAGSYVPEGVRVLDWVIQTASGVKLFYDIDTPVTLAKLARGDFEYIAPEILPELDAYLSFSGGPLLHRIETEFGAPAALPLYCSVDPEKYHPLGTAPTRDIGYLGTYSEDRQASLQRLFFEPARRFDEGRFVLAGACFPTTELPKNVEYSEHVPPDAHTEFYNSLRFALNVTRADMLRAGHSPSVRLFEASACGVPIITDAWPGLEDFLEPGKECLVAESSEQVLDYLTRLSQVERRRIGAAARERVLGEHTALHRAQQLERYLHALIAGYGATSARGSVPRKESVKQPSASGSPRPTAEP